MKFTINRTRKVAANLMAHVDGSSKLLEELSADDQHAALRAIAEHLGPETVWKELGPSDVQEQVAEGFARAKEVREAIRAAGYDPDEVGSAEVIRQLHARASDRDKARDEAAASANALDTARAKAEQAESERCRLIANIVDKVGNRLPNGYPLPDALVKAFSDLDSELDTARAQLREWRETVGPVMEAAPPPTRVVGGGKLEPLEHDLRLLCTDGRTDDTLSLRPVNDCIQVRADDDDGFTVVYLSRELTRRLRDWLTTWLGDSDGYDAVARVALQQARAWGHGRKSDDAMMAIAKEISWSVYRCDPETGPIVLERDGAETKGEK